MYKTWMTETNLDSHYAFVVHLLGHPVVILKNSIFVIKWSLILKNHARAPVAIRISILAELCRTHTHSLSAHSSLDMRHM